MIKKPSISHEQIIRVLKNEYNKDIVSLTLLPMGANPNSVIYKAIDNGNHSYFVKLKLGHDYNVIISFIELLNRAGIEELIIPIKSKQGKSSFYIENTGMIVYPFIQGENGFKQALTEEKWITFGKALKKVHSIKLPIVLQKNIRYETFTSEWRKKVEILLGNLDSASLTKNGRDIDLDFDINNDIDEDKHNHKENDKTKDEYSIEFLDLIKKNRQTIVRILERSTQLAINLQNQTFQFVLCHSDIHAGNILIDKVNQNTGKFYIIDWDHPIMAPKERDLMFIGGGVGNVWNDPNEEIWFYKGYGQTEVNKNLLAYYRNERIIEDSCSL